LNDILQKHPGNHLLLSWCAPKQGYVKIGIPGNATSLCAAMCVASPEIVKILLKAGANPEQFDVIGNDALMLGSSFGRAENIDAWFEKLPQWNVNRCNSMFGATAAHMCCHMCCNIGPRNLKALRRLVAYGTNVHAINSSGSSLLHDAVSNEDADPKLVNFLLSECKLDVNLRSRARNFRWSTLFKLARCVTRLFRPRHASLMYRLGMEEGRTALQDAVRRGDVEIVELLMSHGADPSIKNDLKRDVLSYCEAFPEIKQAIERVKREHVRVHGGKSSTTTRETTQNRTVALVSTKGTKDFTLQRRLSTATDIKYDMYLMSLSKMMKRFGTASDRKKNANICHQDLLKKGELTRFQDLPMGSFVIFVSHQWNGFNHPDPNGRQMQVLSKVRDLSL
jgi:hypothetical protein